MSKFARLCMRARESCVCARKETDTIRKISYDREETDRNSYDEAVFRHEGGAS